MPLELTDSWVWDFWFARNGDDIHIFYLQADHALVNPDLRHWHVSIGHAVSQDLRNWEILPDAIAPEGKPLPNQPEAWDSYTTWTGSIIYHAGLWHMLYTGSSHSDRGLVQRIGVATSHDLIKWKKHPSSPVMNADSEWYELLDLSSWHDQSWRDPYVIKHPRTNVFHAFITARANRGKADERGVIAQATSPDLINWNILPPLTQPGEFGHMEVPQWLEIEGRYYLLFSCLPEQFSQQRLSRLGETIAGGTFYLMADEPMGPFRVPGDGVLYADKQCSLYAGKLIQDNSGAWQFMAFENADSSGNFVGRIIDPLPVTVQQDGKLLVHRHFR